MKTYLPTQPKQPHRREEGETPSPDRWGGPTQTVPSAPGTVPEFRELLHSGASVVVPRPPRKASSGMQQVGAFVFAVVFSLSSYFAVSRYVITAVVVQGRSMAPTLQDGQRYYLNRWLFLIREPRRGDLVVIRDAGHHDYAVKRIVGLPHETMNIHDGRVFIGEQPLNEPYLFPNTRTQCPKSGTLMLKLGEQEYFVLGDNRGNSEDSRYYGALKRDQIVGLLVQ